MRLHAVLPLFLFPLLALVACNGEDDSLPVGYEVRMGTLHRAGKDFNIAIDAVGRYAVADSTLLVRSGLREEGQRLIVSYDLRAADGGYGLVLYGVRGVLTKTLAAAPATEAENAAMGNDAVEVEAVWLAGGYLNTGFRLPTSAGTRPHLVNAFLTAESKDGLPVLELRHNLNGNAPQLWSGLSYASFALPPDGAAGRGCWLRYQPATGGKRTVRVQPSSPREIPLGDSEDRQAGS